jgi:hypothetical protein
VNFWIWFWVMLLYPPKPQKQRHQGMVDVSAGMANTGPVNGSTP